MANSDVQVKITQYPSIFKGKGLTKEQIREATILATRASCAMIRDYAKKNHTYGDRPERNAALGIIGLTRAIHFKVIKDAKIKGLVYVDEKEAPYARYQMFGTKDSKKIHRFTSYRQEYGMGRKYVINFVSGIKGQDFLQEAFDKNKASIKYRFKEALRRVLDGRRV